MPTLSDLTNEVKRRDTFYRQITEQPNYKIDTQRFLDRIKAKQDPKELLDWANALLESHKDDKTSVTMPHRQTPAFILKLDPPLEPYVMVFPKSQVLVDWGGGFGHWGLMFAESGPSNRALYTIEWVPTVYAYHTVQ